MGLQKSIETFGQKYRWIISFTVISFPGYDKIESLNYKIWAFSDVSLNCEGEK
jgi:hypothetical protein